MVLMENLGGDPGPKGQKGQEGQGRSGVSYVRWPRAGQAVREMLRLCIRVSRS